MHSVAYIEIMPLPFIHPLQLRLQSFTICPRFPVPFVSLVFVLLPALIIRLQVCSALLEKKRKRKLINFIE
jgi:hypothetical protein